MQLITEFLSCPEVLFVGRVILATSLFLCGYAMISKITSVVFKSSRMASQDLAVIISLYVFQITFPPSRGPTWIPDTWEIVGFLNLIVLAVSLVMVKYVSGYGLMTSQLVERKRWLAFLVVVLFVIAIFLPVIVTLFKDQLLFPLVYNLSWLLNLGLTIMGAIRSVFGVFKEIIENIIGRGNLAQTIAVFFIIVSIIVIPQTIPYSSIVTKVAATAGILTVIYRYR